MTKDKSAIELAVKALENADMLMQEDKLNLTHCKLLIAIHGKIIRTALQSLESIEGLEEALENLRLRGFLNMSLENKVIIKKAAKAYAALQGGE